MITCLKHNVNFISGECPRCKELKEGINISYKSNNPEHLSKYMITKVRELKELIKKLKVINTKIKKLVEENK